MAIDKDLLNEGETIVISTRTHPKALLLPILALVVLLALGTLVQTKIDQEVVTPAALVDAVWGESAPARANQSLESLVWRLRKLLEPQRSARQAPSVLRTEEHGYRLCGKCEAYSTLIPQHIRGDAKLGWVTKTYVLTTKGDKHGDQPQTP